MSSNVTIHAVDAENTLNNAGKRKWIPLKASAAGELHVGVAYSGNVGQAHSRNIAAANTTYDTSTNTATWTAAENITSITINAICATAAAIQNDEALLVVFDAPDATTASAWLSAAGAVDADVEYAVVFPGKPAEFTFTDALRRIDVLPLNVNMRVVVEAN